MPSDPRLTHLTQPGTAGGCLSQAVVHEPIGTALGDPSILRRLENAAAAALRSWHANLPLRQREAEVEEVVQEAARRALERRRDYDPERRVVPWLVGFVIKVCKERTIRRAGAVVAVSPQDMPLDEMVAGLIRPVEEVFANQLDVRQMLEQLPAADQELVRLRFFEDASAQEVGRRLGISAGAVRIRLFRILTRLKSKLAVEREKW